MRIGLVKCEHVYIYLYNICIYLFSIYNLLCTFIIYTHTYIILYLLSLRTKVKMLQSKARPKQFALLARNLLAFPLAFTSFPFLCLTIILNFIFQVKQKYVN